ncbi:PREDICTED: uncharacterized protein F10E9.5-like [Vollenhovia emeryi]|uniref:uncharacterized protein F10E9.5-like n=1 Tax=Vollenhovia emeryi TaxID=411798 RepID=UPI0005F47E18|nr:PREDICTED: uncharacterized protein F10E9.5-like [Vollenhovia emeryi]
MEFAIAKRRGKCRRRRSKKRLRERVKREVRSARHWMVFPECNVTDARGTLMTGTMQADAFWKNYAVAQEWQKRHSITWWRSRCVALEHENKLLRDKVRLLARYRGYRNTQKDDCHVEDNNDDDGDEDDTTGENRAELGADSNENFEFNVTEDMLSFFETSERHKREMRQKHGSNQLKNSDEVPFVGAAEKARVRKEEADQLYGAASSEILVMETALQSAVERYEDTANPQYWPNISLKP